MTHRLKSSLRYQREAKGQQPLFTSAFEEHADLLKAIYLRTRRHSKPSRRSFSSLKSYIIFCSQNKLFSRAAWGLEELIHLYEDIYGFIPAIHVGWTHFYLADMLGKIDRSEEAESSYLKGLSVYQKIDATNDEDYLKGLQKLSAHYFTQGDQDLGDETTKIAFKHALESGTQDVELLARFQANVGRIYQRAAEHDKATHHLGQALRRLNVQSPDAYFLELSIRLDYARSLREIGALLRGIAQYRKIVELLSHPIEPDDEFPRLVNRIENLVANLLTSHAQRLLETNRVEASLQIFERALQRYEELLTPTILGASNCARVYAQTLRSNEHEDRAIVVEARLTLLKERLRQRDKE